MASDPDVVSAMEDTARELRPGGRRLLPPLNFFHFKSPSLLLRLKDQPEKVRRSVAELWISDRLPQTFPSPIAGHEVTRRYEVVDAEQTGTSQDLAMRVWRYPDSAFTTDPGMSTQLLSLYSDYVDQGSAIKTRPATVARMPAVRHSIPSGGRARRRLIWMQPPFLVDLAASWGSADVVDLDRAAVLLSRRLTRVAQVGSGATTVDLPEAKGMTVEVRAYAQGCQPASDRFLIEEVPSELTVEGTVKDQLGAPIVGATVRLDGHGAQTTSDASGHYTLHCRPGGQAPHRSRVDLLLVRHLTGLRAHLQASAPIIANGTSRIPVTLTVTSEGSPLRDVVLDIGDLGTFTHAGRTVKYVGTQTPNTRRLKTNEKGQAVFELYAPQAVKDAGLIPGGAAAGFPVTGALTVSVPMAKTSTTALYTVESPFPELSLTTGPYIEAGQWQIKPSCLVIKDADSRSFIVTLEGPGAFKMKGDRESEGKGHPRRTHQTIQSKTCEFHYRPLLRGFDLSDEPQVAKMIAETAGTVYISVLSNVGMDKMLKAVAVKYPRMEMKTATVGSLHAGGDETLVFYMKFDKPSAAATTSVGTFNRFTTVGTAMMKARADQDIIETVLAGEGDAEETMTAVDHAVGLVDGTLAVADILADSQKVPWEILKASWEADKTAYRISEQYHRIAEAYQDMVPETVSVTVEDDTGRTAEVSGIYNVLVWKGGGAP